MRSLADAFAAVDQSLLEPVNEVMTAQRPEPIQLATDAKNKLRAALKRMPDQLQWAYGAASHADAEEALSEGCIELLTRHRAKFAEPPENWLGLLYVIAKQRLSKILLNRIESIDGLAATVGESAFAGASPIVPVPVSAKPNPSAETASGNGKWSELTIIEALQDFRDRTGRPPKWSECNAQNGLPSGGAIRRIFGGLTKALLAAGLTPMNQPNGPVLDEHEAAELCASFYRRHGRWPNWADAKCRRRSGERLPAVSAMERLFGGTSEHAVREACERILAVPVTNGHRSVGADVVILHPDRESDEQLRDAA